MRATTPKVIRWVDHTDDLSWLPVTTTVGSRPVILRHPPPPHEIGATYVPFLLANAGAWLERTRSCAKSSAIPTARGRSPAGQVSPVAPAGSCSTVRHRPQVDDDLPARAASDVRLSRRFGLGDVEAGVVNGRENSTALAADDRDDLGVEINPDIADTLDLADLAGDRLDTVPQLIPGG